MSKYYPPAKDRAAGMTAAEMRAQAAELIRRAEDLERRVVSVVYLFSDVDDLDEVVGKARYSYFDGTADGLVVGDRVWAPVRYQGDRGAIVVRRGGGSYTGPMSTITERAR